MIDETAVALPQEGLSSDLPETELSSEISEQDLLEQDLSEQDVPKRQKQKYHSAKTGAIVSKVFIYFVLVLYATIILLPFLIVIITSLKTWEDARSLVFTWIPPQGFTLEGYSMAFNEYANVDAALPMLLSGFFNTLLYILPPTLIGLFTSSLSAYAFSKLRFRAKKWMYPALLATMMIPGTIMIVPQFSIYDMIGWVDTPLPLMIPGMFGAAACVFFMRQFYAGIPDSLVEAAKLDGLGYFGIFFKIMVPLSVPALLAQGLLGFIGGYNDYLGPLMYLQSSDLYTLQIALRDVAGTYGDNMPNVAMAASIIALIPMLIVYFFTQRYFISGIVSSGLKD